jgi:hypothetical protein
MLRIYAVESRPVGQGDVTLFPASPMEASANEARKNAHTHVFLPALSILYASGDDEIYILSKV